MRDWHEIDSATRWLGFVSGLCSLVGIAVSVFAFLHEDVPVEAVRAAEVVPLSLGPAGQGPLAPGGEHLAVPLEASPHLYEIPDVLP